jgi:hypothetical protein
MSNDAAAERGPAEGRPAACRLSDKSDTTDAATLQPQVTGGLRIHVLNLSLRICNSLPLSATTLVYPL